MLVSKTITKEVKNCQDCPYYYEGHDMGATFSCCELKGSGYAAILRDIVFWKQQGISFYCPLHFKTKNN